MMQFISILLGIQVNTVLLGFLFFLMMQFISILLGIQVNTVLLGFLFFSHDAVHINLTRNSSKHSVVGFSVFFS